MNKTIAKGILWMGGLKGVTRLVTFVKLIILARLLSPLDFGLFGIAILALALLETLTDTGINVFFIQREGELKDYLNSAWLVSILRGILITSVLVLAAPLIASFFNSPPASYLIILIALVSFIRGFINPAIVSFQKNLEFKKEFFLRLSTVMAEAVVSIYLSFLMRSALALVWGLIAGVVVEIFISFAFIKPRPKLSLEKAKINKVVQRGKWVTLAGVFQYLFQNGDNIVVGRLLDTYFLGLYQMAYRISTIPITEISDVFSRVTFPIYATMTDSQPALRKAFLKSTLAIFVIAFPIGLILFLFTEPLVQIFLGVKWLPIVPPLKILAVFGVLRALEGATPPLFLALKKQEYVTAMTLVSLAGLGIFIIPLVSRYGLLGGAYSAMIGTLVSAPLIIYYLRKELWLKT